jgi:hypothetical protein
MKRMIHLRDHGADGFSRKAAAEEWNEVYAPWIAYWHNPTERVSSWPGIKTPIWPENTPTQPAAA